MTSSQPEEVVGVLHAIMTRGWKGDLQCYLVFTSERIIVSVMGMLTQAAGSFGGVGGMIAGLDEMKKSGRLKSMSPTGILQSNKKNYALTYSNISKVELGRKLGATRLYIQATGDVYKFKFQLVKMEEIESQVRSLLPPTIPVERSEKLD